jgi:hypothetical protein
MGTSQPRGVLERCIYCVEPPDGEEHWLPRSLGTFQHNTMLKGRICRQCNNLLGRTVDNELANSGPTGMLRQALNIAGRSGDRRKNAFEYKVSRAEPPIQVVSRQLGDGAAAPLQAFGMNPDGTLNTVQMRSLYVETSEGKRQHVAFPKGWSTDVLRRALSERGLTGAKLLSCHVAPPETADEFLTASTPILRDVFQAIAGTPVYVTDLRGEVLPTEYGPIRFELSREYVRGVAKVAFHHLLWASSHVLGNEPEFEPVRRFIRYDEGEMDQFVSRHDSLLDRVSVEQGGISNHVHVFAVGASATEILSHVHFFSGAAGPDLPTYVVRIGSRPDCVPEGWSRAHLARYFDEPVGGHAGELREMYAERTRPI